MQNVATKKVYMVPTVVKRSTLVETTLGVPVGKGEPSVGLIIAAGI